MSLGGFAGGMASAFQKALDREQEEKMEARREKAAQLRQAASFAHADKLYTRRLMDDERKSLRETEQGLKALFGSGPDSLPYVQAWMGMGSAGIEQLKELKEFAKEKRVPFKSYLDLSYPINDETGELFTQENYGAIDLNNTIETMIKRRVGDDPNAAFVRPQIGGVIKDYEKDYSIYNLSYDEVNVEIARVMDNIALAEQDNSPTVELNKELKNLRAWRKTILKNKRDMAINQETAGDSASAKNVVRRDVNSLLDSAIPDPNMKLGLEAGTFLTMEGDRNRYLNAFNRVIAEMGDPQGGIYSVYKEGQREGVSGVTLFNSALIQMNTVVSRKNSLMDQMISEAKAMDVTGTDAIRVITKTYDPENKDIHNDKIGKVIAIQYDTEATPTYKILKGINPAKATDEAAARAKAKQKHGDNYSEAQWLAEYNPYGMFFYKQSSRFTVDGPGK